MEWAKSCFMGSIWHLQPCTLVSNPERAHSTPAAGDQQQDRQGWMGTAKEGSDPGFTSHFHKDAACGPATWPGALLPHVLCL